ncbi:hypothetical protein ADL02_15390 [Streptomyces sp. NRRL WC-3723]|nr:hypothetical protein ADL02_15390 [Streptomyces sp. NRRL WC-3723]
MLLRRSWVFSYGGARIVGVWLHGGDLGGHPRPQGEDVEHPLPQVGLVVRAPHPDAAQLPGRVPQPEQVSGGGQFPNPDGFGRASPVDLGGVGALGHGHGERDHQPGTGTAGL